MQNLNTILVAVDLSDFCVAALKQAGRLASRDGATLHILHVMSQEFVDSQSEYFLTPSEGVTEEIRTQVEVYADRHLEQEVNCEFQVLIGHPVTEILRAAEFLSADLIVVGAQGRTNRDSGEIGIIASKVVRKAERPVLLVRTSQREAFDLVVAAVDFSETSRLALEQAAIVAERDGAILHVVHIHRVPWGWSVYLKASESASDKIVREDRLAKLQDRLDALIEPIRANTSPPAIEAVVIEREEGIDEELQEYVEKIGADLIVVGSRGNSVLKELLLGTTAERLIHHSACSVLTVRPTQI